MQTLNQKIKKANEAGYRIEKIIINPVTTTILAVDHIHVINKKYQEPQYKDDGTVISTKTLEAKHTYNITHKDTSIKALSNANQEEVITWLNDTFTEISDQVRKLYVITLEDQRGNFDILKIMADMTDAQTYIQLNHPNMKLDSKTDDSMHYVDDTADSNQYMDIQIMNINGQTGKYQNVYALVSERHNERSVVGLTGQVTEAVEYAKDKHGYDTLYEMDKHNITFVSSDEIDDPKGCMDIIKIKVE